MSKINIYLFLFISAHINIYLCGAPLEVSEEGSKNLGRNITGLKSRDGIYTLS